EQVAVLAARWGDRGPMLVLSDHGHMPRGGHGGAEPAVRRAFLVLAGPGVRAGGRVPRASTVDVAPTLAALLGVPAPGQALGRTLFEVLALDDDVRRARGQAESRRLALVGPAAGRGRQALVTAERHGQLVRALIVLAAAMAGGTWLRRLGR